MSEYISKGLHKKHESDDRLPFVALLSYVFLPPRTLSMLYSKMKPGYPFAATLFKVA